MVCFLSSISRWTWTHFVPMFPVISIISSALHQVLQNDPNYWNKWEYAIKWANAFILHEEVGNRYYWKQPGNYCKVSVKLVLRVVTTDFLGCPLWLFLYLQYILSIASRSFLPLCLAFVFNAIFVCLPHVILTGVCPFNSRDVNMFCNLTFWLFDQILNCYFVCRPFRKVLNIINQVAAEWIPSACNIFRVFFITLHKKWTFH